MGDNSLAVHLFVQKLDEWTAAVRTGYEGLREFFMKNFLLVRDVYKNRSIPQLDGVQKSFIQLAINQPIHVLYEKEMDCIEFDCDEAIRLYTIQGQNQLQAMRYPAGHHSINWRIKEFYVEIDTAQSGNFYIWGLF